METTSQRPNYIPCPNCGGKANFSHTDDLKRSFYKCEKCSSWILLPDKPPSTRRPMSRFATIRVNPDDWEAMKEIAYSMGFTRNGLINMFIKSVVMGESKIEKKDSITYVNINLVPITNQNVNVNANQTKMMKNQLTLDKIRKQIEIAYRFINDNKPVPQPVKDRLEKLLQKAIDIPPELFEEARKILFT